MRLFGILLTTLCLVAVSPAIAQPEHQDKNPYSPQEVAWLTMSTADDWDNNLKKHLDAQDYKEYNFSVFSRTPPQRYGDIGPEARVKVPWGWAIIYLSTSGTWTMNKPKGDRYVGPEGYEPHNATKEALCYRPNKVKFGQLILCDVTRDGDVPEILNERYPFPGLLRPDFSLPVRVQVKKWKPKIVKPDLEMLPFMNDLITDNGKHYQTDNDGSITCRLVVINPKAKLH